MSLSSAKDNPELGRSLTPSYIVHSRELIFPIQYVSGATREDFFFQSDVILWLAVC